MAIHHNNHNNQDNNHPIHLDINNLRKEEGYNVVLDKDNMLICTLKKIRNEPNISIHKKNKELYKNNKLY